MTTEPPPLRPLGNTGIEVSAIGLGTVGFGRSTGLKYRRAITRPTDQALEALLTAAEDCGINLLDTATAYGDSQQRIGQLRPPGIRAAATAAQAPWVVMTKVGERHSNGRSHFDFSARAITEDLAVARAALQRPVLDVVLLHAGDDNDAALLTGDGYAALRAAQARGAIRAIGISLKTEAGFRAAMRAEVDVIMATLNRQQPQLAPLIAEAGAQGIGVVVKKPLASGALALDTAPGAQRSRGENSASNSATGDSEANLRWILAQPGVSCAVVGTLNSAHLRQNAASARASARR